MNAIVTHLPAAVPAPTPPAQPPYRGVQLHGFEDSLRASKVIVASGTAPRSLFADGVDPVAAVWAVIQLGAEVGLTPMASVQNIALINGRPGLYGPAMLAVVEASGKLESIEEWIEGEGDARTAYCRVKRIGRPAHTASFAVADSKRAGLWDKRGKNGSLTPWQQYPDRMLMMRARSFALKDRFPDVLMGLGQGSAEELADIPVDDPPPKSATAADLPPAPPQSAKSATVSVLPNADPAPPKPSKTTRTFTLKGWPDPFPYTGRGFLEALDALECEGETSRPWS
jgi:hypothetical protein